VQSNKASGVSISIEDSREKFLVITVEDHQQLKQIEDDVADLMLCLDSTSDTLHTFKEMYDQYLDHREHVTRLRQIQSASGQISDAVAVAFREKAKEIQYTRRKAESLLSKIHNTRTLVSRHHLILAVSVF
jgi:vacuolar-type H+-ATPase catalytic subunit A/Vma1